MNRCDISDSWYELENQLENVLSIPAKYFDISLYQFLSWSWSKDHAYIPTDNSKRSTRKHIYFSFLMKYHFCFLLNNIIINEQKPIKYDDL